MVTNERLKTLHALCQDGEEWTGGRSTVTPTSALVPIARVTTELLGYAHSAPLGAAPAPAIVSTIRQLFDSKRANGSFASPRLIASARSVVGNPVCVWHRRFGSGRGDGALGV